MLIGPAIAAALGAFLLTVTVGTEWVAMQRDMDLSPSMTAWIFVAYLLPSAIAVAIGVPVGRRWPTAVALIAVALMIPGALLTTLAPGSGPLTVARAVTGFGAGLAWGVTAVLVAQMGARRARVAPFVAGAVVLALVLGPVVGAFLARAVGWRFPFILAVPFGVAAFLATAVSGVVVLTQGSSRTQGPKRPLGPYL